MGFKLAFGKKKKMERSIRAYVTRRLKEKRSFQEQLKRLEFQLQNNMLDKFSYERMREVLEINFVQQQEESRAHMQNAVLNASPF
jgi:uncharacterized membrane protein YheB (UPF0754 family)